MSRESQFEREENDIQERYARGEITNKEMWAELSELQRDYAGAAQEAAMDAYEAELDRW